MERATELEFLKWWYLSTDFGPCDSDVSDMMKERFMRKKNKNLPGEYNTYSDGETCTDKI